MRGLLFFILTELIACQPVPTVIHEAPVETQPVVPSASASVSSVDTQEAAPLTSKQPQDPLPPFDKSGMIEVPAGSAILGSTDADVKRALELCRSDPNSTRDRCRAGYFEIERPQREVTVGVFWIDKFEVTVAEYTLCIREGWCTEPSTSPESLCAENTYLRGLPNHPVNCVSWKQARTYCKWRGKRLPAADEWEKAARGPNGQTFPWGEETPTCEHAYAPNTGECADWVTLDGCTAPIGKMPYDSSFYGVMDLAGNVSEWTSTETAEGHQIIKGGGCVGPPSTLRGADFMSASEEEVAEFIGFRCAYSEEDVNSEEVPAPGL